MCLYNTVKFQLQVQKWTAKAFYIHMPAATPSPSYISVNFVRGPWRVLIAVEDVVEGKCLEGQFSLVNLI